MHALVNARRLLHLWWKGEDIFLSFRNDSCFFTVTLFTPSWRWIRRKKLNHARKSAINVHLKFINIFAGFTRNPRNKINFTTLGSRFRSCMRFLAKRPQCNTHYQSYHCDLRHSAPPPPPPFRTHIVFPQSHRGRWKDGRKGWRGGKVRRKIV